MKMVVAARCELTLDDVDNRHVDNERVGESKPGGENQILHRLENSALMCIVPGSVTSTCLCGITPSQSGEMGVQ